VGTKLLRYFSGAVIVDVSALLPSFLPHVFIDVIGAEAASRTEIQASK